MRYGNLPLLHQLAEEYNTAVNHALSSYVPNNLSMFVDGDDDDSDDSDDDDELGYELEELEDEMIMMLSFGLKKRRIELPDNQQQTKRQKYDTKKLHFTNPITMERSVFTFEYSIWYCNYITNPSPERSKWSNLFRTRFRMP